MKEQAPQIAEPMQFMAGDKMYEQVTFKNGVNHLYEITDEGKKIHASHDAVLAEIQSETPLDGALAFKKHEQEQAADKQRLAEHAKAQLQRDSKFDKNSEDRAPSNKGVDAEDIGYGMWLEANAQGSHAGKSVQESINDRAEARRKEQLRQAARLNMRVKTGLANPEEQAYHATLESGGSWAQETNPLLAFEEIGTAAKARWDESQEDPLIRLGEETRDKYNGIDWDKLSPEEAEKLRAERDKLRALVNDEEPEEPKESEEPDTTSPDDEKIEEASKDEQSEPKRVVPLVTTEKQRESRWSRARKWVAGIALGAVLGGGAFWAADSIEDAHETKGYTTQIDGLEKQVDGLKSDLSQTQQKLADAKDKLHQQGGKHRGHEGNDGDNGYAGKHRGHKLQEGGSVWKVVQHDLKEAGIPATTQNTRRVAAFTLDQMDINWAQAHDLAVGTRVPHHGAEQIHNILDDSEDSGK